MHEQLNIINHKKKTFYKSTQIEYSLMQAEANIKTALLSLQQKNIQN